MTQVITKPRGIGMFLSREFRSLLILIAIGLSWHQGAARRQRPNIKQFQPHQRHSPKRPSKPKPEEDKKFVPYTYVIEEIHTYNDETKPGVDLERAIKGSNSSRGNLIINEPRLISEDITKKVEIFTEEGHDKSAYDHRGYDQRNNKVDEHSGYDQKLTKGELSNEDGLVPEGEPIKRISSEPSSDVPRSSSVILERKSSRYERRMAPDQNHVNETTASIQSGKPNNVHSDGHEEQTAKLEKGSHWGGSNSTSRTTLDSRWIPMPSPYKSRIVPRLRSFFKPRSFFHRQRDKSHSPLRMEAKRQQPETKSNSRNFFLPKPQINPLENQASLSQESSRDLRFRLQSDSEPIGLHPKSATDVQTQDGTSLASNKMAEKQDAPIARTFNYRTMPSMKPKTDDETSSSYNFQQVGDRNTGFNMEFLNSKPCWSQDPLTPDIDFIGKFKPKRGAPDWYKAENPTAGPLKGQVDILVESVYSPLLKKALCL